MFVDVNWKIHTLLTLIGRFIRYHVDPLICVHCHIDPLNTMLTLDCCYRATPLLLNQQCMHECCVQSPMGSLAVAEYTFSERASARERVTLRVCVCVCATVWGLTMPILVLAVSPSPSPSSPSLSPSPSPSLISSHLIAHSLPPRRQPPHAEGIRYISCLAAHICGCTVCTAGTANFSA